MTLADILARIDTRDRIMRHFADALFWGCYRQLPQSIEQLVDENFNLLTRTINIHRCI